MGRGVGPNVLKREKIHMSLISRLKNIHGEELALQFGPSFLSECAKYDMEKGPKKEFYQKHLFNLKLRASEFLKKLLFEVELRIPKSNDLFRGLSALHEGAILKSVGNCVETVKICTHIKNTPKAIA